MTAEPLDLNHIEALLFLKKSQAVIDLLPSAYPEDFSKDYEDILKVAVLAAKAGDKKVIAHFLTQYASNPTGQFAFHDVIRTALFQNHQELVSLVAPHWLKREPIAGQSLMDYAIRTENPETVRFALSLIDQCRPSPLLMFGVDHNNMDIVERALEKGAKPAEDRYKALSSALAQGHTEIAERLWPYLDEEEPSAIKKRIALTLAVACITNDDACGFLRRSVAMAGDDMDVFRASAPLQGSTFRFSGRTPINIQGSEAFHKIDSLLSHSALSQVLNEEPEQTSRHPAPRKMM